MSRVYSISKATMDDVRTIHELLNHFADKGLLLGRSLSSLYDQLRDFKICRTAAGQVAGVCALHICWENLAEIRSLAVSEPFQRSGVGTLLVTSCLDEAVSYGISKVFTLTYQPGFFRELGFVAIDKSALPHKVWSDCIHCAKFPDCNEEALEWRSEEAE